MKKKLLLYSGAVIFTFALVANLQYALINYGMNTNTLGLAVLAQGSSGGTSGGGTSGGGTSGGNTSGGGNSGGDTSGCNSTEYQLNYVEDCVGLFTRKIECKSSAGNCCANSRKGKSC